ncbi:aspartate/tyrosine/aromatic aminotransferase [Bosea sp. SSUT16]|jgi:aspartate aminotransferase|uniref:Aspartate/tyrosine/aromatic aminotransferase n=1 Tax=Bosea spartocytisi TaxID=2773451 RepID=A0A927ECV1_9HYPH|nr:aromatic amino acid transaminase [Bosea spartocytisi]MBD3848597.1 aspartate/tyrosine/aromatic aminotransferase [Bosea spartocytisi]MCT4475045.1 aromatic amino acid transaminase [Bosea spartocytisi]
MFIDLPTLAPDPLWGLNAVFQGDPRAEKINLVIGVYRDDQGVTPTMQVVRDAERELVSEGASKAYRPLVGNQAFNDGMAQLLLGEASPHLGKQHTIQTVGATGALRLLGDLVARANSEATVWSTDPAYVNHRPLMETAGLRVRNYRWREQDGRFDIDAALDDLAQARAGDVILLHGCCHNPTGIDLPADRWAAIAELCNQRGLIPFVDTAYQGFGDGLDEDALGLRLLVDRVETVLISASCSKNMGLYCERTGTATVVSANGAMLEKVPRMLEHLTRSNYSVPPEHGAAIAIKVFEKSQAWRAELEAMRCRIVELRNLLADALQRKNAPAHMLAIRQHKGMFSTLKLSAESMERLRREFAVYGTDSGRLNIAGLRFSQIDQLAEALSEVAT